MRKIIISLLLLIAISSCSADFSRVSVGMDSNEVEELVGKPDSIVNNFFSDIWYYETHLVTIENGKVTMVRSKEEIRRELMKMQEELKHLKK